MSDGLSYASSPFGTRQAAWIWFFAGLAVLAVVPSFFLPYYLFWPLLATAIVFGIGIVRPRWAYFLAVFILYEELVNFFIKFTGEFHPVLYFPYVIPICAAWLGRMVGRAVGTCPARDRTPLDVPLVLVAAYETLSLLWTPDTGYGIATWFAFMPLLMLFAMTVAVVRDSRTIRIMACMLAVTGMIDAGGIIASQWIDVSKIVYVFKPWCGFEFTFDTFLTRPSGFGTTNHAAGFCSIAIFQVCALMLFEKSRLWKFIWFAVIAFLSAGVFVAQSRGTLLGLIGGLLFLGLIHPRLRPWTIKYSVIVLVLIVAWLLIVRPSLIDRMMIGFGYTGQLYFDSSRTYYSANVGTNATDASGMRIRIIWWKNGLKTMDKKPWRILTGLGIGSFPGSSVGEGVDQGSPECNSVSFAFFYDMGLFGILLFGCMGVILFTNLRRHILAGGDSYAYHAFIAAVAGFVAEAGLHGLVDYDITGPGTKIAYLAMALMMATMCVVRKEEGST